MYKCIIIVAWFSISKGHDLMWVKHNETQYYCMTNSSSALTWINEDINRNNLHQQVSKFISETQHNFTFNEESAARPWSLEKSSTGRINQVILDRRWESFPTLRIPPSTDFFNRTNLVEVVHGEVDFVVPFSVRADAVDILFDDGGATKNQTVIYWLFLQGSHDQAQKEVRIMKCPEIHYEENLCELHVKQQLLIVLNSDEWSHFKLEKRESLLTLTQIIGTGRKITLLQYNDPDLYSVGNMYVNNYLNEKSILWKNHKLDYIYTNKKIARIGFGLALKDDEDSICVSMFLAMCESCKLTLSLSETKSNEILEEKIYSQKTQWSEIKFIKDIKHKMVVLSVSTSGKDGEDGFWAIDEIQQCQKGEWRMITSELEDRCQLISYPGNVIPRSGKLNFDTIQSYKDCPENTVGKFCLPCSLITSADALLDICETDECYSSKCSYATEAGTVSKNIYTTVLVIVGIIIIIIFYLALWCIKHDKFNLRRFNAPGTESIADSTEAEGIPLNIFSKEK